MTVVVLGIKLPVGPSKCNGCLSNDFFKRKSPSRFWLSRGARCGQPVVSLVEFAAPQYIVLYTPISILGRLIGLPTDYC